MLKLNASNLKNLGPDVQTPQYDPANLKTGIVHFGVGAFHRSHQAMYLDRLLNTGSGQEWGICGVGVLPSDARMRDALEGQDYLYTLLEKAPDGSQEARVIGVIHDYLFAPDDPEAVIEKLAHPDTRIVSLTVTEGGYSLNNATGEFDPSGADIQHDLQQGATPRSTFGLITEGLRRRRERDIPPFTVMSCDNIQSNGHVTGRVLTAFARLKDADLGEWMAREVAFPNSMVDRITPATTDEMREQLATHYGVMDAWPVVAEDFTQWVLEDHFTLGRPALEGVGVQVVPDVEPYELMKLRLLNASHQALAYPALLDGFVYVHDVCRDPDYAAFLLGYMQEEATPTLRPVPGIDLNVYRHQLISRFSNEAVRDTLTRLVVDASERIPKFLLPVVREQLARGGQVSRAALVVACWCAYINTLPDAASLIDPRAQELKRQAAQDEQTPGAFLNIPEVFGELAHNERFRQEFIQARHHLRLGPREAMKAAAHPVQVTG